MANIIDSLVVKLGFDNSGMKSGAKEAVDDLNKVKEEVKEVSKEEKEAGKAREDAYNKGRSTAKKFFDAITGGAEKAAEGVKSLQEEEKKNAKEQRTSGKAREESFNAARSAALRFVSVLTLGAGAIGFAKYVVNTGATLDRMSENLGTSADTLSRWQGAVRQSGGTAEGALSSFQGLNSALTELKLTGTTGILPYIQALGVSLSDENGKAKELDAIMMDIGDALKRMPDRQDAYNIGRNLGLDDGTVNLLLRSREEIEGLIKAQQGYSDADAKAARQAQENWEKTKIQIEQATQKIVTALLPALTQVAESFADIAKTATPFFESAAKGFNAVNEATDGWLVTLGLALVALKGMKGLLGFFGLGGAAAGGAAAGGAGAAAAGGGLLSKILKLGGPAAALFYSGGLNTNEDEELKKMRSGKPTIDTGKAPPRKPDIEYDLANKLAAAEKENGLPAGLLASIVMQETSNKKEYIQNPAKYHYERDLTGKRKSSAFGPFGLLDSTARDPGYGVKRLENKSLDEQIRFAAQYAAARIKSSGSLEKGMAGYGEGMKYANEVIARMGKMNGAQVGNSGRSNSVSIGEVKVYTQATDAAGIARDLGSAIVRQADFGLR